MNNSTLIYPSFQFLLLSGGGSSHYERDIDTTEIFDINRWVNVGKLPWALGYFHIGNIDNRVLSFGKHIHSTLFLDV